jgi:hypothetical protein
MTAALDNVEGEREEGTETVVSGARGEEDAVPLAAVKQALESFAHAALYPDGAGL